VTGRSKETESMGSKGRSLGGGGEDSSSKFQVRVQSGKRASREALSVTLTDSHHSRYVGADLGFLKYLNFFLCFKKS
jgi:hypothetical protein